MTKTMTKTTTMTNTFREQLQRATLETFKQTPLTSRERLGLRNEQEVGASSKEKFPAGKVTGK